MLPLDHPGLVLEPMPRPRPEPVGAGLAGGVVAVRLADLSVVDGAGRAGWVGGWQASPATAAGDVVGVDGPAGAGDDPAATGVLCGGVRAAGRPAAPTAVGAGLAGAVLDRGHRMASPAGRHGDA